MDAADSGLEGYAKSVRYPVLRSDTSAVKTFHLHSIPDIFGFDSNGKSLPNLGC